MNIKNCVQFIEIADVCGQVPLIRGLHGVGKTQITKQYADANDLHYEVLILSLMDTGDMLGIPDTHSVGGMQTTVWAAPNWYTNIVNAAWPKDLKIDRLVFNDPSLQEAVLAVAPTAPTISRDELNEVYCAHYNEPNDRIRLLRQTNVSYADSKRSLLHLDEFNRAPPDILNASLQLVLDYRLHSHELPIVDGKETLIVSAVNPADGSYTVQEFDPALLDRFVVGDVEPDLKSWMAWAKKENVNVIVRDFLQDNANRFHFSPEDGSKGTSPRSWTRLATYIDRVEAKALPLLAPYVIGTLGSAVAAQFLVFYENYATALTSEDIIKRVEELQNSEEETLSVETIGDVLSADVEAIDAVKRQELADALFALYIDKDSAEEAVPLLAYLYALPLETLAAVLKTLQTDNAAHYGKLARLDKEANKKRLFFKIASYLKL